MLAPSQTVRRPEKLKPLVVDLDGTLLRSDLLIESAVAYLGESPLRVLATLLAVGRGKAALKAQIASRTSIDPAHLPYDEDVLDLIRERRAAGQQVFLASASNERYVQGVAAHLGLFDGWFASDDKNNLSGTTKALRLVEEFGEGGFDYVGNERADLCVWAVADRRVAVRAPWGVKSKLLRMDPGATVLEGQTGQGRALLKLLRVHQWTKNLLVFVPLITAHRFGLADIADAVGAFLAFSLVASAVYILNDLVDLDADRKHPTKMHRPLAAGNVPIFGAVMMIPLLLAAGFAIAFVISGPLAVVLLVYFGITTAYTFFLKRKMFVDVIALALLYTVRVIGGAAATAITVSEWLLGFSMFMFISLALIKRYVELTSRIDKNLAEPINRNYRKSDLDIVAALAAAAGFNAVTVFALYISSDAVRPLYQHSKLLWLICPILMYWLGRALIMAHRRLLDDDPIVFALRDRNSFLAVGLIGLILLAAR
jgi:4-hydroxybenzoate polyprenyltransferase/phosphoserine phosphatase